MILTKTVRLFSTRILEVILGSICVILGGLVFHLSGNGSNIADEGRSLFSWIGAQWIASGGDFSHAWIMPIVSLALVVRRRDVLFRCRKEVCWWGMGVVLFSLLLHVAAFRAQQPRVSLVAMVGLVWGVPCFIYGRKVARILAFPCGYLLLCFVSSFLVYMTFHLRLFSSVVATGVLNGLGLVSQRSGTAVFSAAGGGFLFDVADPCSGLRSLVVMTALAAPYAYLTQKSRPRKWCLFFSSVPLAAMANILRIVTIALVAQLAGKEVAQTVYHDYSGYVVFVLATLLLMGAGKLTALDYRGKFEAWKRNA